jgi:hydrogenase expression/formation protein HypE
MHHQVGPLVTDEHGIAVRGVLQRQLVMPGRVAGTPEIMQWIARELGSDTYVNLMAQHHPACRVSETEYPEIKGCITQSEFRQALDSFHAAGWYGLTPTQCHLGRGGLHGRSPVLDLLRAVIDDRERMGCGQSKPLPVGKLPLAHLRSLLRHPSKHDPRLLIGPQIGEDAAVIDAGDRYLVVATDPVTFATDQIGRYAVHINANDVAVLGARPLWFFVVMLLPENRTTPELAEAIMGDVRTTCEELGIALGGGHTEITQGIDRPILVGQMLGEVVPTRLVRKTRIAIGDQILLTQGVAIEGTAILAREKSERLRGRVDADLLARAARFLIDPGISVVSASLAAANVGEALHAMHDATEGGLATGLFELVAPGGLGLSVIREQILVFPETDAICNALALDPLKLLASGALLIVVATDQADSVLTAIRDAGISVAIIGEVRPANEGITIVTNRKAEPLTPAVRDEIARAFEGD